MIRLQPIGAEALLVVLAEQPYPELPLQIATLADAARRELGPWLVDLVPGWTTLLLHYDLLLTDHAQVAERLAPLLARWPAEAGRQSPPRRHEIPIWYAGADLAEVARACGLSQQEVIAVHCATEYRVGAIGFAPGFAYLGELDQRLVLPRRATPRTTVPAGSLAIAERQTAIYPQASPGGWHLLGRCPWRLFDATKEPPCPLQPGDRVLFQPIDAVQFQAEASR
ncbi:allophanate hydrolase [Stutzerimonas stutzeri]|uniref:Allophanate hydrolase n=1 Tax=Stutzerimonas stutzeri TaxID=316 RepID=A0A2N8T3L5_STUST|nr:5-oxoprolinase subunit PxpB [Stutzerimonas stutzeri]MCQ4323738.1 5-oxoprolinase subunit PxpB [Stutzerimonas stutzeri]PNG09320.1 allophanate hydrolase [Stutzerimonas stutzeri]